MSLHYVLRTVIRLSLILLLIVLFYLNFRLYYSPIYEEQEGRIINKSVESQLKYLKHCLHGQEGGKLAQSQYPEGFVFFNVLYGLTWCDFIANMPSNHPLRKEGIQEINWALKELNNNYAAQLFPHSILPSRGIFYVGWKNYLLGKKLSLLDKSAWKIADKKQFEVQSATIYAAYEQTKKTYWASYTDLAWPA